jgi:hypothetical protein
MINLIAAILHAVGFSFYLFMLYYSGYPPTYVKGCVYLFMSLIWIYLIIDEWDGVRDFKQLQFNTVNKCIFICNFTLSAFTIFNLCDGVYLMFIYLFAVALTSLFILNSGLQHDYFKDEL